MVNTTKKMEFKREEIITGLNVEKRTFTWRIRNFDMVRSSKELIRSQNFRFEAGDSIDFKTEWMCYLNMYNKREQADLNLEKSLIGFAIECIKWPEGAKEVNAAYEIYIKRDDGRNHYKCGSLTRMIKYGHGEAWGFRHLFEKDANTADLPLIDGCLVIEIEQHLYAPTPPPPKIITTPVGTSLIEAEFQKKFTEKLQSDLAKLFGNSAEYPDAKTKIVSSDNVEFGVNKCILSVRSSVFKGMLETDMEEAKTGVIRIDDLRSKTLAVLLRYICTGTLHEDWSSPDVIVELVYAAEKYDLLDLKEFLDNVLGKVCSKETAGNLLNLANKLGMKKAVKEIYEKMKKEILNAEDMVSLVSQVLV